MLAAGWLASCGNRDSSRAYPACTLLKYRPL